MAELPLTRLLDEVLAAAREAGDRILEVYRSDFAVAAKNDRSPLTEADLAAHRAIEDRLARLEPALPVLSEESAETPFEERSRWRRYWLVDPLDGTKEFVKRNGEFTVNIALIDDHRPVLGVVHVPVSGVRYYAARGLGALRCDPGAEPVPVRVRARPRGRLTVIGSRSHRNAATDAFIERLEEGLGEVELIGIGSSLKICLVAEGKADVYPRFAPTSEWDTAAAQCVLEQAGGRLTDTALEPLRYNEKAEVINPWFLAFGDPSEDWRRYIEAGDAGASGGGSAR